MKFLRKTNLWRQKWISIWLGIQWGELGLQMVLGLGSLPGSGICSGRGNGNPLQCSCLGNPMDRGAWWATVHGVARVGHDWSDLAGTPSLHCEVSGRACGQRLWLWGTQCYSQLILNAREGERRGEMPLEPWQSQPRVGTWHLLPRLLSFPSSLPSLQHPPPCASHRDPHLRAGSCLQPGRTTGFAEEHLGQCFSHFSKLSHHPKSPKQI